MFALKEEDRFNLTRWILFQIILVVIFIPWIQFSIIAMTRFIDYVTWVSKPGIATLISTFSVYSGRKLNLPLFLILSFLPVITLITAYTNPLYVIRYTIAASLSFYILIAKGIDNINNRRIKLIMIILIIALSLNAVGREYTTIEKQQCREIGDFIDKNVGAGDLLIVKN